MQQMNELENKLRKHAQTTISVMQTPFTLTEIKNMEEHTMIKNKSIIKRTVAIAALLALCIIIIAITPLANPIEGFFKDIKGFGGAITGTQYENATNDIKIDVL